MTSPFKRVQQKHQHEYERWERVAEIAVEQGYILTHISPRRSIIIKLTSRAAMLNGEIYGYKDFFTLLQGEKVFGPAPYRNCMVWLLANLQPLPKELT